MNATSATAALLAIGALAATAPARASQCEATPLPRTAQCGKPDLVDMVPPDCATDVPRNARLGAHYAASADYLDEDVVLVRPDGGRQILRGTWDATEQLLLVTPSAPLDPNAAYEIHWPTLRGLNAAAPGLGGTARFDTSAGFDAAPPVFAGVTGLAWDLERTTNDCIDEVVERFVFDVDLGAASDDGGTSGLTLMLFQTAGPLVGTTPMPIPARAWPKDGGRVQVKLATGESVGEICFAGIVRDTIGQTSESGAVTACVHTTAPPFFRGCSMTGGDAPRPGRELLTALALGALLLRRRMRRR